MGAGPIAEVLRAPLELGAIASSARWARVKPNLIVFLSNLAIMVIELVASRLVARHIGSSLYTWTSVIGVILAGMSAGSHIGGKLADRPRAHRILPALFLASAALSLSVLWVNDLAGRSALLTALPLPVRIFTTVSLVFFAPACLLGTISPVVARLALDRTRRLGVAIGNVYAWGSVGNIAGTFLTGFVLLSRFGTTAIVCTAAASLGLIGVVLAVGEWWSAASSWGERAVEPAGQDARRSASAEEEVARPASGTTSLWRQMTPNLFVFLSGMSIMVTEMIAGRVLAKEIGPSLYSWTSVIGVTLTGIALGNWLGGKLADRFAPERILTHQFLVASVMVMTTLYFYDGLGDSRLFSTELFARQNPLDPHVTILFPYWTLDRTQASWPYAYGSLARIVLYPLTFYPIWVVSLMTWAFLLPAAALGTISPVASKLALERSRAAGTAIGDIYAWGALGSIVGTFLPSYFLVALIGIRGLICATATTLAVTSLGLTGSAFAQMAWASFAVIALLGATVPFNKRWVLQDYDPVNGVTPHLLSAVGQAQNVVAHLGRALNLRSTLPPGHYEAESSYFHIKVYPSDRGESRTLLLDHLIHGYAFRDYPRMLKYDYERVYASIMERAHPSNGPLQAFFMGGGSYTFPRFVEAVYPGSRIVVAEIDPAVTEAVHAEMFLPRDTKVETIYGDARNTVDRLVAQGAHFDFIYGDAFNDVTIPFHLTTHEFDERLLRLLEPDGIYLSNLIDTYRNARFLGAFIHTARQTFAHVAVFATGPEFRDLGRDTYTIVMSPLPIDLRRLGALPGERPFSGLALSDADIQVAIERSGPTLLTDDYAPVDNLLAAVARER